MKRGRKQDTGNIRYCLLHLNEVTTRREKKIEGCFSRRLRVKKKKRMGKRRKNAAIEAFTMIYDGHFCAIVNVLSTTQQCTNYGRKEDRPAPTV